MKLFKFLLPFLFIFSCTNSSSAELDDLYDALVKGHDEVMPKSMAIPAVIENMNKAVEAASEEKQTEAAEISARLQKAEEDMNQWMVAFGEAINSEELSEAGRLETYKKLKEEIVQLKEKTETSLADAKQLTVEVEL